ncbi:MAG: sensor histidine kinase [Gorillibacterium sp.]|nr:sensor histidine kinase [Gorillibacterium sp.]
MSLKIMKAANSFQALKHKVFEARKLPKREWSGLDSFIFALRTIWFAASVVVLVQKEMDGIKDALVLGWFFLSFITPQLFFRPGLIRPFWYVVLEVTITGGLFVFTSTMVGGESVYKFLYLPLSVGYLTGRRGLWTVGPGVVLFLPLLALWFGKESLSLGQTFDFLAYYFAFYGLGLALNLLVSAHERTKELLSVIREKNGVLEQYARQVENMTLLEERSRMARELHDTVGHTFTSVIIGMDALRYQIDVAPEEAKESLRELLSVTRQGLDETRSAIHQMGIDDSGSLNLSISRMAEEFARHTCTEVDVQQEAVEPSLGLSQAARLALVRCLQESLTNAKRHGQATHVSVQIDSTQDRITLAIIDNGVGADPLVPGFGIRAMRERLAALQGSLQVTSRQGEGGGTSVVCSVPLRRGS